MITELTVSGFPLEGSPRDPRWDWGNQRQAPLTYEALFMANPHLATQLSPQPQGEGFSLILALPPCYRIRTFCKYLSNAMFSLIVWLTSADLICPFQSLKQGIGSCYYWPSPILTHINLWISFINVSTESYYHYHNGQTEVHVQFPEMVRTEFKKSRVRISLKWGWQATPGGDFLVWKIKSPRA